MTNHKLKQARETLGLSQAELGRRIKISPSCVSQVENGHRRPWPRFRRRCARVLKVTESELFGGESDA